ncbi:MAG: hypothetical protein BMS9Abin15_0448 [Gammaproteobacteria bacterium]|nr:MAG: hypothetical protein BMS9Abin15_0448 [Gammaproteobacteria bacterium]
MHSLAALVMKSRSLAIAITVVTAIVSFLFPPIIVLSLAVITLLTLRRGSMEGVTITTAAMVAVILLGFAMPGNMQTSLVIFPVLWLPVLLLATIYRQTVSLQWTAISTTVFGVVVVIGFYLAWDDPQAVWLDVLEHTRPMLVQTGAFKDPAQVDELIKGMARIFSGVAASVMVILLLCGLLMGRWWQAMLFNPGGFRREFHALRLGPATGWLMLAMLGLSLMIRHPLLIDITTVVWVVFAFQGLAMFHGLLANVNSGLVWLSLIYISILLLPTISVVLSGIGLLDTWFDFRARRPGTQRK